MLTNYSIFIAHSGVAFSEHSPGFQQNGVIPKPY